MVCNAYRAYSQNKSVRSHRLYSLVRVLAGERGAIVLFCPGIHTGRPIITTAPLIPPTATLTQLSEKRKNDRIADMYPAEEVDHKKYKSQKN